MANANDVVMKVVEVKGKCPNGHHAGEEHLVQERTPKGICLGSFGACFPYLVALRYGADFPWESEKGVITLGCPDHVNQVVWRLERIDRPA